MLSLYDDDDDENSSDDDDHTMTIPRTIAHKPPNLPRSSPTSDVDDSYSILEEDTIDRMIPSKKRRRVSAAMAPRKKVNKTRSPTFQGRAKMRSRQHGIREFLTRPGRFPVQLKPRKTSASMGTMPVPTSSVSGPSPLSILDVLQPGAPNFLRIAARTAKKRRDLGKSSPFKKTIDLGNRRDNVDALSVLSDWKIGVILPRIQSGQQSSMSSQKRIPLQQLSTNTLRENYERTLGPGSDRQRGSAKQMTLQSCSMPDARRHKEALEQPAKRPKQRWIGHARTLLRPAHLESVNPAASTRGRPGLLAGKRLLDAVYRGREKELSALSSTSAERTVANQMSSTHQSRTTSQLGLGGNQIPLPTARPPQRRKGRKARVPRCIDTAAARFTHANGPLPSHPLLSIENRQPADKPNSNKLMGLGPFGTQYTMHFEIFPLDAGVYFHETTLVGNGRLRKATDPMFAEKLRQRPPRFISFRLGERAVSWGPWDDTTSSELGILLDWMAEQVEGSQPPGPAPRHGVVSAADSLLEYVQDYLSFDVDAARSSFSARCAESLSAFLSRVEEKAIASNDRQRASELQTRGYLDVLLRLFLVSYCVWRLSPASDPFTEGLVKSFARCCVSFLLTLGLGEVRGVYDDLQRLSYRERGIRADKETLVAWVCVMTILTQARLPRTGFWDVTYSVMLPADLDETLNVAVLEELWKTMFSLLPLTEFGEDGVLDGDSRHVSPLEGWGLPQRALKNVFTLYDKNTRQSPGFNGYCRALVGRCHHLVQQWGWRRCLSILGTIFDFFGSHQLAHLRNEEVYKSPGFLDDLNGSSRSQLSVEAEDRCFHVFLKMLALVLLRLRQLGHTKEIRNLVARTLPNHDRQYLKEHTVRQHDLAALRNHHDLLCTLFWAATADARPPLHLIEKLVAPASSHKEACLINLRAWSQLARWVVASGEPSTTYKEFLSWQTNVFQQVLGQHQSAAADVQQQAAAMSKNKGHSFSGDLVNEVVAKNQAAAMDILHASVIGSLDVLKCAPSLQATSLCLNTSQLSQVLTKFDLSASNVDWGILLTAIQVIEEYMSRLETALDRQYSSDQSSGDDSHIEEAVLMLDHRIAQHLFSTAHRLSSFSPGDHSARDHGRTRCTEKAIILSARLASRLIQAGVAGLSRFFQRGTPYYLFEGPPHRMSLAQRKYLPLFVTTLIKNNVFDFKDIGATILHLWMLSIVKPLRSLAYENYFADTLKRHGMPYMERAFVAVGSTPDYASNRDYFERSVASMRRSLREADMNQRRRLRVDFQGTLTAVMQQMKTDLEQTKDDTADGHFVGFVRDIIGAIKSFGVGIATIDPFYYQMTPYYAPPREDPQLQTAGIVSYGIRAGEGDAQAIPQLFHYLCNNLKMAIAQGRLDEEIRILGRAMENNDVLSFMLGRMFPAIVEAVGQANETWPWLSVYSGALEAVLTRSSLPREIDEENMADVIGLVEAILHWQHHVWDRQGDPSCTELYTMVQLTGLANVLQPTLASYSWLASPPASTSRLQRAVSAYADFAHAAAGHLSAILDPPGAGPGALRVQDAAGAVAEAPGRNGGDTGRFAQAIIDDVRQSWVVQQNRVAVRVAGVGGGKVGSGSAAASAGSQSGGGISFGRWDHGHLAKRLHHQVRLWNLKPTRPTRLPARQSPLSGLGGIVF